MLDHSIVRALETRWEAPPPAASKRRKKKRTDQTRIVLKPAPAR